MELFLKPTSVAVPVGDQTLQLVTPLTIAQHSAFVEAVNAIDVGALFEAVAPVLSGVTGTEDFVRTILVNGPTLLRRALALVGPDQARLFATAAGVVLDNEASFDAMKKALGDPEPKRESGFYMESPALRAWIASRITVPQLWHVMSTAAEATYLALGKAIASALTGAIKKATAGKSNGQVATTPSEGATS